jgi:hypothetical protein
MHRVRDSSLLVEAFDVDRIYLRYKNQGLAPDYRVRNITCKNNINTIMLNFSILLHWFKFAMVG